MGNYTGEIFKKRELNDLLSDSISFYGKEAKGLLSNVFTYVFTFIILKSVFSFFYTSYFYYEYSYFSNFIELLRFAPVEQIFYVLIIKLIDFSLYSMIIVVVGTYVKNYTQNGSVNKKEIGIGVKQLYIKILGSNLLIGIILGISLIALLIPFIYLFVIFSVIPFIIIFENESIGNAFSKSFKLLKKNWLKSFGAFVVIFIICLILKLIVTFLPRLLVGFIYLRFPFIILSIISGFLYASIAIFPILLSIFLYTSYTGQVEIKKTDKPIEKKLKKKKKRKEKTLYKNDNWEELQKDDENKNRFLENGESDRFKPKY